MTDRWMQAPAVAGVGAAPPPAPMDQPPGQPAPAAPADLTDQYNTTLTPDDEAKFGQWITTSGKQGDLADYDLRGAWKAGQTQDERGHLTDEYKKPNHPTFSDESIYNGVDGAQGGRWVGDGNGKWKFEASSGNLKYRNADQLQQYFSKVEPDSALVMPAADTSDPHAMPAWQAAPVLGPGRPTGAPPGSQGTDDKTGAPYAVRALVGSAPDADKLANLQRFYPDAKEVDNGNYVFTNPQTGKLTLYNPPGFDMGDAFSVAREGSQAVGGAFGAVLGGAAGGVSTAPAGGVGLIPGAVVGAGLGTAAGGSTFDVIFDTLGGRIDTRSTGERLTDAGMETLMGSLGQRGGELVGDALTAATRKGSPAVRSLIQAYQNLGIQPSATAVSGSRTLQNLASGLESSPLGAEVMQREAERVIGQTKAAAERVANSFGPVLTDQGAGMVVRDAAEAGVKRFELNKEAMYDRAFDMIGAGRPVAVDEVRTLRTDMQDELAKSPATLAKALDGPIKMLQNIEADAKAAGGGIEFASFRAIRTMIGRLIDETQAGSNSTQNIGLQRIYAAISLDMGQAARSASPAAEAAIKDADTFTRTFMSGAKKTLDKIARFDSDERAWQFVQSSSLDGGAALSRLRANFEPEEWDIVAGSVLGKMGLATPGAQNAAGDAFSPARFLTVYSSMKPAAKEALFGGTQYANLRPALDDLVAVVGSLKETAKTGNKSNTARALASMTLVSGLAGGLGGMAAAGVTGTGVGAMAIPLLTASAQWSSAKLLVNPAFVRWLATPVTPSHLPAHIGRLSSIAALNPEIRNDIANYVQALKMMPVSEAQ